jgi:hypothetical protein
MNGWTQRQSSHFSSPNRHIIYVDNSDIVRLLPCRLLPHRSLPCEIQEATNYENDVVQTLELWICREWYSDRDEYLCCISLSRFATVILGGEGVRPETSLRFCATVDLHSFRLNTGTCRVRKAPSIHWRSTIWRCYMHQISLIFGHVTSLYVYYQLNAQINWGMAFLKFIKSTYSILWVRHWIWQGGALIFFVDNSWNHLWG